MGGGTGRAGGAHAPATYVRILGVVVPQRGRTVAAEGAVACRDFVGRVVCVKLRDGLVLSVVSLGGVYAA